MHQIEFYLIPFTIIRDTGPDFEKVFMCALVIDPETNDVIDHIMDDDAIRFEFTVLGHCRVRGYHCSGSALQKLIQDFKEFTPSLQQLGESGITGPLEL